MGSALGFDGLGGGSLYTGEDCHLALAYYQTGLADEGWKLLMGTYREGLYNSIVPGAVSPWGAGTDFSDASTMFCRLIVEGLFGYVPNSPADRLFSVLSFRRIGTMPVSVHLILSLSTNVKQHHLPGRQA